MALSPLYRAVEAVVPDSATNDPVRRPPAYYRALDREKAKRAAGICPASGCWAPRARTAYCELHAEKRREYMRRRTRQIRAAAIAMLGGRCVCCGEADPGFLSVDHIDNDGGVERDRFGPRRAYERVLKGLVRAELRCYNCNLGRAFNGGVCPHEEAG